MNTRSRFLSRLAPFAAACALGAASLLPASFSAAQTEKSADDTTNRPAANLPSTPRTQKPKRPDPSNPLILVNPQDGSGNARSRFDRDGNLKPEAKKVLDNRPRDYRREPGDPRLAPRPKRLPLFGYDFFRPARDIIRARRAFLLQFYPRPTMTGPTHGTTTRRTANRPGQNGFNTPDNRSTYPPRAADQDLQDRNGMRQNRDNEQGTPSAQDREQRNVRDRSELNGGSRDRQDTLYPEDRYPDDRYPSSRDNRDSGYNNDGYPDDLNMEDRYREDQFYALYPPPASSGPYEDNGQRSDYPDAQDSDRSEAIYGPSYRSDQNDPTDDTSGYYDNRRAPVGDDYQDDQNRRAMTGDENDNENDRSASDNYPNRRTNTLPRRNSYDTLQNDGTDNADGTRSVTGNNETYRDSNGVLRTRRRAPYSNDTNYPNTYPYADTRNSTAGRYPVNPLFGPNGQNLPVDAFTNVADPLTQLFRNVTASAPANYQLAPGDTLTIRYGSPTQDTREITRTVDARGSITLEEAGQITVRGLTADQAEKAIRTQLRRFIKAADVSVTLGRLRTISVTVLGAAFEPGTYTVPANVSAYNALNWAGGPTYDGSLRNIEVRRGGKVVGKLDVYKLQTGGANVGDILLQAGDIIYIPPRESRVVVSGEVLHPAIFELTHDETLQDALRYAGGVKATGVNQRVHIKTLVPGTAQIVKDVDVKDTTVAKQTPLYDGDAVDIFSVRPLIVNKVTIEGAINQPGDYELVPGMRVSDLLARAQGALPEVYTTRADLYRWNPDNTTTLISLDLDKAIAHDPTADISLTRWDRLKIYDRKEVAWTGRRTVTVRGAVQRPGVFDHSQNMKLRDLLLIAGGPTPDAYMDRAILLHQHGDGTFAYDFVNLASARNDDPAGNVIVQDNDVLAVYRVDEAHFEPEHFVTIQGDVVGPGIYPRAEGMKVNDLLTIAGGFKPGGGTRVVLAHARRAVDTPNAMLLTQNIGFDTNGLCQDNVPLEDGDVVTVQGTGGFINKVPTIRVVGAVQRPGPIPLSNKQMRLTDALREVGGLRPEAFPEGTEFYRDPRQLSTAGQRDLAFVIGQLSNLLNDSEFKRRLAQSDIERIRAAGAANQGDSVTIPGLTGAAPAANPAAAVLANNLSQHDLVSRPRTLSDKELQPNGNIAVNLPDALRKPGGTEDILLVDGDTITIPEKPTTVQVVGAVINPRGVLYKPGASLDYYIEQSGGLAVDAAPRSRILIIHAGGGLIPASKARELRPGDQIIVPTRVLAEKIANDSNSLDKFFRGLTNSAVTVLLATRLFGL